MNETNFWETIIKWVIAITGITGVFITSFGFVWNARERRRERKEDAKIKLDAITEKSKKEWADNLATSVVDMKEAITGLAQTVKSNNEAQNTMNQMLISKIDETNVNLKDFKNEVRDNVKTLHSRIDIIERNK